MTATDRKHTMATTTIVNLLNFIAIRNSVKGLPAAAGRGGHGAILPEAGAGWKCRVQAGSV